MYYDEWYATALARPTKGKNVYIKYERNKFSEFGVACRINDHEYVIVQGDKRGLIVDEVNWWKPFRY